jgi:hypothetical protein
MKCLQSFEVIPSPKGKVGSQDLYSLDFLHQYPFGAFEARLGRHSEAFVQEVF